MDPIIGAIIGGIVAYVISIPIFSPKGGRMVRPGLMEYDPARGDVPPGGCGKMLGNILFIAAGAAAGAFIVAVLS